MSDKFDNGIRVSQPACDWLQHLWHITGVRAACLLTSCPVKTSDVIWNLYNKIVSLDPFSACFHLWFFGSTWFVVGVGEPVCLCVCVFSNNADAVFLGCLDLATSLFSF